MVENERDYVIMKSMRCSCATLSDKDNEAQAEVFVATLLMSLELGD